MLRVVVAMLAEVRTSGTTLDWSGTSGTSLALLAKLARVSRSGEEPHISKSDEQFIQVFDCECLPEHWVGLISVVILRMATMISAAHSSDNWMPWRSSARA